MHKREDRKLSSFMIMFLSTFCVRRFVCIHTNIIKSSGMLLNVLLHVFEMSVCLRYQKLSSDLEQYRSLVRSLSQQAIRRTHSGQD